MVFRKTHLLFLLVIVQNFFITAIEPQAENKVEIVQYEKERDEQAIIEILNEFPQFLRYETAGLPQGTTEKYINDSNYTTYVLQENGKTVAFISFMKLDRKLLFLNFGSIGFIHLMGVHKDCQRRKYGTALLIHAIRELLDKGISIFMVGTKVHNEKARNFYEKFGFVLMSQIADDCLYVANVPNDKAPEPTREEKVLNYAIKNPGKALICIAAIAAGGSYLGYKVIKKLLNK